jgi:hypothetical protein
MTWVVFIPDQDPDFLTVPDLGSGGQKGTGSRIRSTFPGFTITPKAVFVGLFFLYMFLRSLPQKNVLYLCRK